MYKCSVCKESWVIVKSEVKDPKYVCNCCRGVDTSIPANSPEFDVVLECGSKEI